MSMETKKEEHCLENMAADKGEHSVENMAADKGEHCVNNTVTDKRENCVENRLTNKGEHCVKNMAASKGEHCVENITADKGEYCVEKKLANKGKHSVQNMVADKGYDCVENMAADKEEHCVENLAADKGEYCVENVTTDKGDDCVQNMVADKGEHCVQNMAADKGEHCVKNVAADKGEHCVESVAAGKGDDRVQNMVADKGEHCVQNMAADKGEHCVENMVAENGEHCASGHEIGDEQADEVFHLPEDMWLEVMKYLPLADRYHLTMTCQFFHRLFSDPSLWRSVDLACYLITDKTYNRLLSLKPRHKLIISHFGHLFHYIRLKTSHSKCAVEDETINILSNLLENPQLKGLQLITLNGSQLFFSTQGSNVAPGVLFDDFIIGLLSKAKHLQHLDLSRWPIQSYIQPEKDGLNLANILSPEVRLNLRSLNIATSPKLFSRLPNTWAERETITRSLSQLVQLRHLCIWQTMLSDHLLRDLASPGRAPLRTLIVLTIDPTPDKASTENICNEHLSQIPEEMWFALRTRCPNLELHVEAEVLLEPDIAWLYRPCVPLTSLILRYCTLPQHDLSSLLNCQATLQSLHCDVMPYLGYDQSLIQLVTACTHLRHLVFYGKIYAKTIRYLAAMNRQWCTFRFKFEHIILEKAHMEENEEKKSANSVFVFGNTNTQQNWTSAFKFRAMSEEIIKASAFEFDFGDSERQQKLDTLCQTVSKCLGYSWKPCRDIYFD